MSSDADRGAARERRDDGWLRAEALRAHYYDIRDRGSKPEDPGWHVCTCGWEGYWIDWHTHVADILEPVADARLSAVEAERDAALAKIEAVEALLGSVERNGFMEQDDIPQYAIRAALRGSGDREDPKP